MIQVMAGARYGKLTFVRMMPPSGAGRHRLGLWRCDCGVEKPMPNARVTAGRYKSCGCLAVELSKVRNRTHGMHNSPAYRSWQAMIGRCHSETHKDYPRWGACGVTVCDEWRRSFEAFFAHVGPRPLGTTLDRYPNFAGNYEPSNVRWATPRQQARNRRDFVVIQTPAGVMPLIDYAAKIGISEGAAHLRLKRGKLEGCSRV